MRHPVVVAALLSLAPAVPAAAQQPPDGRWEGAILVLGTELGIGVAFRTGETGLAATIDIPQQGAKDLPLINVRYEAPRIHFELQAGPGLAAFDGTRAGDSITGTFAQAGVTGTFRLTRAAVDTAGAAAPAADAPPYHEEEVTFTHGEVTLAGTLTLPDDPQPHPAVILISGSGPQNRNEEIFGFQPFRLLADHLARRGVAVLRYDDRGVGGSTGNTQLATTDDFAGDVLAAVALLEARADVRPGGIGLIGHSEGGIVGPLAATRSADVAFLVLLAGTAVPGEAILLEQLARIMQAGGAADSEVVRQQALQRRVFAAVRADSGWDAIQGEIEAEIRRSVDQLPPEQRAIVTDVDALVKSRAAQQLMGVRTPWFRSFLDYDPAGALSRVMVPVLALFGEHDLQVPPAQNTEPMRRALEAAGNRDVTIEVLPGANHLFQRAQTGAPAEYASLEKEFAPGFLDRISDWIAERASRQ
jgi:pimeloyl-ACP methyl ester carboxylesterase